MATRPPPISLQLRGAEAANIDRALRVDARIAKLSAEHRRLLSRIGIEIEAAAAARDLLDVLNSYQSDGAAHARVDALNEIRRAELAKKRLSVDLLVTKRLLERQRALQRTLRHILEW